MTPDRSQSGPLNLHQRALRIAPFALWVAGAFLVVHGSIFDHPGEVAVTMLVVGMVLLLSGALVTRAESFKAGKDGVEAKLTSIVELEHGWAIGIKPVKPDAPAELALSKANGKAVLTGAELVASATANGWSLATTTGSGAISLTRPILHPADRSQFSPGDLLTVALNAHELPEPVPARIIELFKAAGFTLPEPVRR